MFSMKFAVQHARQTPNLQSHGSRNCPRNTRGVKVTVVGAAEGVGQPLSLLLKQNAQITTLALQDKSNMKGIAADLSHICTPAAVESYDEQTLDKALENAAIVIVSSGIPHKPGMKPEDVLQQNAKAARDVAKKIAATCPEAMLAIVMSPLNAIVPVIAKQLMEDEAYDPSRLFGVTTLDVVRAKTFLGESIGVDPLKLSIPVIGGYAGETTLPLFSQSKPKFEGSPSERMELIKRIQSATHEKKKDGSTTITLSEAYASANFINSLLRAMNNEQNVIECAYVQSDVSEAQFFASPVLLGPKGIVENLGLPELDEFEEDAVQQLLKVLIKDIDGGLKLPSC